MREYSSFIGTKEEVVDFSHKLRQNKVWGWVSYKIGNESFKLVYPKVEGGQYIPVEQNEI